MFFDGCFCTSIKFKWVIEIIVHSVTNMIVKLLFILMSFNIALNMHRLVILKFRTSSSSAHSNAEHMPPLICATVPGSPPTTIVCQQPFADRRSMWPKGILLLKMNNFRECFRTRKYCRKHCRNVSQTRYLLKKLIFC